MTSTLFDHDDTPAPPAAPAPSKRADGEAPDLGWTCDTCGLSDYGFQRLSALFPKTPPRPCFRCRDHFTAATETT